MSGRISFPFGFTNKVSETRRPPDVISCGSYPLTLASRMPLLESTQV